MKTISAYAETLAPFSIAMALLVFAIIPGSVHASSTTYYVDIPNLGSYGNGGNGTGSTVSYLCNGSNCTVNGNNGNNGYGATGYGSTGYGATNGLSQNYANSNNYPNYAYQYFKNPNPNATTGSALNSGSGYYGGQNGSSYVPVRANYVPYDFPTYAQYVRQADGTYKLGSPKAIPTYGWNADNSLISGSSYAPGSNTGNTGRGFVMTSSGF